MKNVYEQILIISPSPSFTKTARKVMADNKIDIDLYEITDVDTIIGIDNAVEYAKEVILKGKEIIITRGTFASTLHKITKAHIIDVEITDYEILQVMYKYKDSPNPVAVAECNAFYEGIKRIGDVINTKVSFYNVENLHDYKPQIEKAIDDGITTFIGGAFAEHETEYIKSKNITHEIIKSTEATLLRTINSACDLSSLILKEREDKDIFKTLLDFSVQGIIAIDKDSKITIFNHSAEKIFNLREVNVIGEPINDLIPMSKLPDTVKTGEIEIGSLSVFEGTEIIANRAPILIKDDIRGAFATFYKVKDFQETERKLRYSLSEKGLIAKYVFDDVVTENLKMKTIIENAKTFSKYSSTILVTGETGTGKEVFAQAIHNESNRKNNPFVAVNCSALPDNLLESELFGYSEGAFTGARKGGKVGLFELAHGGTIFLDEIGEVNKTTQVRLLRVIQEREIISIGGDRVIPVDVRIIAATNKDLFSEVQQGDFRSDLYYRLNVLNLHLPPLRERIDDIDHIVTVLLAKINKRLQCKVKGLDYEFSKKLKQHNWPGNIRELQNVLEKIVALTGSGIAKESSTGYILQDLKNMIPVQSANEYDDLTLEEIETLVIKKALEAESYNKTTTAKRLGIGRSTLLRKLEKL